MNSSVYGRSINGRFWVTAEAVPIGNSVGVTR